MAKISASEMKRVVALMKARKPSPADLARRGLFNRPPAPVTRRLDDVRRVFEKAGIDVKKLDEIAKRDEAERRRLVEKQRAATKKALAAIKDPSRHGIEERHRTLELLSKLPRPDVDVVFLEAPFLIWAHPFDMLDDSTIVPGGSKANFHFVDTEKSASREVDFHFIWQNNYGQEVLINAEAIVRGQGQCGTDADIPGGFGNGIGHNFSEVGLDILELWNNPWTSPLQEQSQTAVFADTGVNCVELFGADIGTAHSEEDVLFGRPFFLAHNGFFIVPRNGSVVFKVYVWFGLTADNAKNWADFTVSDDAFLFVECNNVVLKVIVPPIATT